MYQHGTVGSVRNLTSHEHPTNGGIMRPIIEQPRSDDDFYSPEFIRFLAAAVPVIGALWSVFGLWLVAEAGCRRV